MIFPKEEMADGHIVGLQSFANYILQRAKYRSADASVTKPQLVFTYHSDFCQGWTGKVFFHGAGWGKAKNIQGGAENGS